MWTSYEISRSINVQTFTVGALNLLLRAVEAAEDNAPIMRAKVVAATLGAAAWLLFALAWLLRALAWSVDFAAYVLVGAAHGVLVLAIGVVAVLALALKMILWVTDLATRLETNHRRAAAV